MDLHGIHHITAITADAQANVDFYTGVLGLRFVKKTVNFDDPSAYHLYYADETGSPGSVLTFFEYPGAPRGEAGQGMVHRIVWRVADEEALDFWEQRLESAGMVSERTEGSLRFSDPEGLDLQLVARETTERPLAAASEAIPERCAVQGFDGVRAYSADPGRSRSLLEDTLGFELEQNGRDAWRAAGEGRSGTYVYDPAPLVRPSQGAGTVHHIAWAVKDDEQAALRERVLEGGAHPTGIVNRIYFRSVYFREPSGVLFELATLSPGFAVDEPLDRLGESLRLPPWHEHLRPRIERQLTPISVPRRSRVA
jgi:glyoxalase family protein